MRKKERIRKAVASCIAAVSAVAAVPVYADASGCLGEGTFDEDIGIPWHAYVNYPASQHISISGGTYNCTIVDPGGSGIDVDGRPINGARQRGGDSRWDCGFSHKGIHIEKNHKYKIHWEVESDMDGELSTQINDVGTVFDNGADFPEGVWQNNSKYWSQGWDNVKINRGKNSFDSEFTADRTIENAEWVFHYGGPGPYQVCDCFPEGTTLKFDNMILECETCGDTFKNERETPCLWDPSNELGVITPRSGVRINQIGYFTIADKKATYVTTEEKPAVSFVVKDRSGKTVFEGIGKPVGKDPDVGEYCQILDFSECTATGTGFTIEVDDKSNIYHNKKTNEDYDMWKSHEFVIGDDIYRGILQDTMNYYYLNRSGTDIDYEYITSYNPHDPGGKIKLAHAAFNEKDKAYIQGSWKPYYTSMYDLDTASEIDVTGGWYTSSDYSKNVLSGAQAVWLLQNMYEMSKKYGNESRWNDDKTMRIPQKYEVYGSENDGTGYPDVLDETRYELEWMFSMIVDPEKDSFWGETCEGLVYHEVNDAKTFTVAKNPVLYREEFETARIIRPPTYAATFNMIACAAQAARLWRGIDDEFADRCIENAERSWDALWKMRTKWENGSYGDDQFLPYDYDRYGLGGYYDDLYVQDEAYWAACELFSTTGDKDYYDYLKSSEISQKENNTLNIGLYSTGRSINSYTAFNIVNASALGTLTLWLSEKTPEEDKKIISENIISKADKLIERENEASNSMEIPYQDVDYYERIGYPDEVLTGYDYGSNAYIANNSIILAYAYNISRYDTKYLQGIVSAMDYLFGRNGLGISYVTGCGTYHVNNPSHRYWINELDREFPMAPDGVMVSGPFGGLYDLYTVGLGMKEGKIAPQKCYADSVEACSENNTATEFQAAFAWNLAFLELGFTPEPPFTTTATTVSVPDGLPEPKKYGDANCDDIIDMADAVLIMQSLANPDKYAVGGSDVNAITKQGASNADVDRSSPGLTGKDALCIQKYLLKVTDSLDPSE